MSKSEIEHAQKQNFSTVSNPLDNQGFLPGWERKTLKRRLFHKTVASYGDIHPKKSNG